MSKITVNGLDLDLENEDSIGPSFCESQARLYRLLEASVREDLAINEADINGSYIPQSLYSALSGRTYRSYNDFMFPYAFQYVSGMLHSSTTNK